MHTESSRAQNAGIGLLGEHLEHLRRRGLASATVDKRRVSLVAFAGWLGDPITSATRDDIESFLDSRRGHGGGPIADRTRYQWVSQLSCFYQWAIDYGHTDCDPTVRVVRPRMDRLLPRPIGDGDLIVALESADPMMYAWIVLASYAGLRVSEIARLRVENVLHNDGLLRVLAKRRERLVPMHEKVALVLSHLPRRGYVFRRPRGGPWPPWQVSREGSMYFESLGVEATLHQCRHWFGTKLYAACRDLRVVQELMGHASPTTSAQYAAWSRQEARRAVDMLDSPGPSLLSEFPASEQRPR